MAVLDDTQAGSLATRSRRLRWRERWTFSPLVAVLAVILLIVILPPTLYLIVTSFYTTRADGSFDQPTLRYYQQLFTSPYFASSLGNTVIYAVGSAFVAIVLGSVQALIVERTNTPGRRYVFFSAVVSLGIPHVLYVVAWLLLLGRSGPVNSLIDHVVGAGGGPSLNVYSMWGMILVEGVGFAPLTFLLMSAVLRSTDASFEEAALMSGAGALRTFRSITLRLGLPGVLALMLLVGIRAFESFEVPALVGLAGNVTVLTTNIYQSSKNAGAMNFGESGAYAVCLLAIVVLLLMWHNRLAHHANQYQTITGKGYRPRIIDLGRWRYVTAAMLLGIFILVIMLPVGILVFTSLLPFYEGVTWESWGRFTLENYHVILGPGSFRDAIANTLILGGVTASLVVPVTALCAWLAVRRYPGAWLLDQIAMMPLVFPGIVMSVAFLHVYVNLPIPLYGTLISVIIASAVRYLPYGMRYAYAGVLQIHTDLEDAATTSGAGRAFVFVRVVLPLIGAALVSCWLFVFLLTVQSVALPLLLVGPGTELIAVTLFDLWQNGQVTELAAMGVLWMSFMLVVAACFHFTTRRYQLSA
ncbi:MAG: iron(III) transport system permease protein [Alphaproteobacteria bacterium]|nr:iron(III) transport system permease protein [Alphaproteobacteria bacterium]